MLLLRTYKRTELLLLLLVVVVVVVVIVVVVLSQVLKYLVYNYKFTAALWMLFLAYISWGLSLKHLLQSAVSHRELTNPLVLLSSVAHHTAL